MLKTGRLIPQVLMAALLCVLLHSCNSSDSNPVPDGDMTRIHIIFEPDQSTRSLSVNETTVNDITVLVFNTSSGDLVGSNYTTFSGTASSYSMDVMARTGACTIYAVANTGSSSYFKDISTMNQFKKMYDQLSSGDDLSSRNSVLMFAKTTCSVSSGITIDGLSLTRLCTKMTCTITPSSDISVTGIKLCSVPLSSYISDDGAQSPAYNPTQTWVDCSARYAANPTAGNPIRSTCYMYENLVGSNSASSSEELRNSANAPAHATYLEVYAKKGADWHSTYRIYLGGNSTEDYTNFDIQRNANYNLNISITGPGQSDARVTYTCDAVTIGNYLYANGTWGSSTTSTVIGIIFSNTPSLADRKSGWTHGYAMALKNVSSSSPWGASGQEQTTDNSTWASFIADKDGLSETNAIQTNHSSDWTTSYPAFYGATQYHSTPINTSGWYLPSIGQWYDICVNLGGMPVDPTSTDAGYGYWNNGNTGSSGYPYQCAAAINARLSTLQNAGWSVDLFSNIIQNVSEAYWTSSEYSYEKAYNVMFTAYGVLYLSSTSKAGQWTVRPVIAF